MLYAVHRVYHYTETSKTYTILYVRPINLRDDGHTRIETCCSYNKTWTGFTLTELKLMQHSLIFCYVTSPVLIYCSHKHKDEHLLDCLVFVVWNYWRILDEIWFWFFKFMSYDKCRPHSTIYVELTFKNLASYI